MFLETFNSIKNLKSTFNKDQINLKTWTIFHKSSTNINEPFKMKCIIHIYGLLYGIILKMKALTVFALYLRQSNKIHRFVSASLKWRGKRCCFIVRMITLNSLLSYKTIILWDVKKCNALTYNAFCSVYGWITRKCR